MELSQIAKARKKGGGAQAIIQRTVNANPGKSAEELSHVLVPEPKHVVSTPTKKVIVRPKIPNPYLAAGGVLAVAGGGAYLAHRQSQRRLGFQKRRVEKSLSSMHSDYISMMMRST